VLEHPAVVNVILCSTVLNEARQLPEHGMRDGMGPLYWPVPLILNPYLPSWICQVKHRSLSAYDRARALIANADKRFHVFINEHSKYSWGAGVKKKSMGPALIPGSAAPVASRWAGTPTWTCSPANRQESGNCL
jgi:hypothetical protein